MQLEMRTLDTHDVNVVLCISLQNSSMDTALHIASQYGHTQVVKKLIEVLLCILIYNDSYQLFFPDEMMAPTHVCELFR